MDPRSTDLRDSFGSCSSSGATHFGETLSPSFSASNRTRLSPVCRVGILIINKGGVRHWSDGTDLGLLELHDVTPLAGDLSDLVGAVSDAAC